MSNHHPFAAILAWIGVITTAAFVVGLIDFVRPYLRPSQINRFLHTAPSPAGNSKDSSLHPWALITGTTSGIGLALAHELASLGFNVVLHGRNPSKLNDVQQSLQNAFPSRQFRTLVVDASTCTTSPDIFKDITARLNDIHLTALINNAGGAVPNTPELLDVYHPLALNTHASISSTISLNLTFPIMLTSTLLPVLSHRNSGPALIITIGSFSDSGMPLVSVYSGAKAALRYTMEGLSREVDFPAPPGLTSPTVVEGSPRSNITIHHMRIGSVTGVSHNQATPSLFMPNATTVAKAIVARVGCGRTIIEPHWTMRLQSIFTDWFPWWVKDSVFRTAMVEQRDGVLAGETM